MMVDSHLIKRLLYKLTQTGWKNRSTFIRPSENDNVEYDMSARVGDTPTVQFRKSELTSSATSGTKKV